MLRPGLPHPVVEAAPPPLLAPGRRRCYLNLHQITTIIIAAVTTNPIVAISSIRALAK